MYIRENMMKKSRISSWEEIWAVTVLRDNQCQVEQKYGHSFEYFFFNSEEKDVQPMSLP